MDVSQNIFLRRKYDAMLNIERQVIRAYAESCFLNIQILQGNLCGMERLDVLMAELSSAEQELAAYREAFRRIDVHCTEGCHLDEQECLDLFEAHFTASDIAPEPIHGIFRRSDFREMLKDIYGPS